MYLKVGNTKILASKFSVQGLELLEINFEYVFSSYDNYRRFVNVVADTQHQEITIKIKSKFSNTLDCEKLSQLLIGVSKIITQDNIALINQILEGKSSINLDEFLTLQQELIKYFL